MSSRRRAAAASLKQRTLKPHTFNINSRYLNCEPVVDVSMRQFLHSDQCLKKTEVQACQLRLLVLGKAHQGTPQTGSQRDQEDGGGEIQILIFDLFAQPTVVLKRKSDIRTDKIHAARPCHTVSLNMFHSGLVFQSGFRRAMTAEETTSWLGS